MLQNHIHLSTTLGGSPENAPDLKWVASDRKEIPVVFLELPRTLTGRLKRHMLTDDSGEVQLTNYLYVIKVQADFSYTLEQRRAQLKAMHGKVVYLCDHFHASSGSDHTADVVTMVCKRVGEFVPVGPGLPFFQVEVELEDHSLA
jgi:hypothetical protein